jgi:hypothetical protein
MTLTNSNYFSQENNMKFFSASQFKSFLDCESMALAELKGEYQREKTTALLVGSYVDSYIEGTLDDFKLENPEIFLKNGGGLKADYKHAEYIIQRIERDSLFMQFLSGQKQVIKTGEIEGVPFKIKIDSYSEGKAITDLKVMRSFDREWQDGLKISFVEKWKYDLAMSIYQEIEGNKLPIFLAAVTKEKEPDLAIINIPQERLDVCLDIVKKHVKRFDDIKKGLVEPKRCESCDFCKSTKKLTQIISYEDIGE